MFAVSIIVNTAHIECSYLLHMEVKELRILEEIGQGSFGRVYKAVWCGTVVAAKEISTAGNQKVLVNKLSVYR